MKLKALLFGSLSVALLLATSGTANAASFNSNDIISDAIFDNTSTMDINSINGFLNQFGNSCISLNSGFASVDPTGYNPTTGYQYGGFVSAGQVIYDAAQAYGVNPQVLITTLEKEQSLVTGRGNFSGYCNNGDQHKYAAAVGYGCPDSGTTYSYTGLSLYQRNGVTVSSTGTTCVNSASKAGFSQQVIRAAWLLKFGEKRSEGNVGWAVVKGGWNNYDDPQTCYGGPMTQGTFQRCPSGAAAYYDGYTSIDNTATHMDSGATAALYWYTPHFSGNQSFYNLFTGWFGSTMSDVQYVIADNGDPRQWLIANGVRYHIPSADTISAWGLGNKTLVTVNSSYLGSFVDGPDISRTVRNPVTGAEYLADNGLRHQYVDTTQIGIWKAGNFSDISPLIINSYLQDSGPLGYTIKFNDASAIYMVDDGVLRQYSSLGILQAIEDTSLVANISADYRSHFTVGSAIVSDKVSAASQTYLMDNGRKVALSANIASMYPGTTNTVASASITRMPTAVGATNYLVRSGGAPEVYLIDGGVKRHITTPQLLQDFGGSGSVLSVSSATIALIPSGTDITSSYVVNGSTKYILDGTAISVPASLQAAYINSQPTDSTPLSAAYLTEIGSTTAQPFIKASDGKIYAIDGSNKRWITSLPVFISLSNPSHSNITSLTAHILNAMPSTADFSTPFVTNSGTTYYIENGNAYSVDPAHYTSWGSPATTAVTSGLVSNYAQPGAVTSNVTIGGVTYFVAGQMIYRDSASRIALWTSDTAQAHTSDLSLYFPKSSFDLPLFAKSSDKNDGRIFIKDTSKLIHVLSIPQLQNFAGSTMVDAVTLPASQISSQPIVDSSSVVFQLSDSSTQAVVSGQRLTFASAPIAAQWQTTDMTSISDQLKNAIPASSTQLNSMIKAQGQDPIYSVESGTKHWVYRNPYLARYSTLPVSTLPAIFVAAYPTGADIVN